MFHSVGRQKNPEVTRLERNRKRLKISSWVGSKQNKLMSFSKKLESQNLKFCEDGLKQILGKIAKNRTEHEGKSDETE